MTLNVFWSLILIAFFWPISGLTGWAIIKLFKMKSAPLSFFQGIKSGPILLAEAIVALNIHLIAPKK